jgi:hypothetical protein
MNQSFVFTSKPQESSNSSSNSRLIQVALDKKLVKDSFLDSELTYEDLADLVRDMESKGHLNIRSWGKHSSEILLQDLKKNGGAVAKIHTLDSAHSDSLHAIALDALEKAAAARAHIRLILVIPEKFEDSKKKWLTLEHHLLDIKYGGRTGRTKLIEFLGLVSPQLLVRSLHLHQTQVNMLQLATGVQELLSSHLQTSLQNQ